MTSHNRTSTRYEEYFSPDYISTPVRPINVQQNCHCAPSRARLRNQASRSRLDFTSGVALVPRRIDCKSKFHVQS